jgi:hypothetical protein
MGGHDPEFTEIVGRPVSVLNVKISVPVDVLITPIKAIITSTEIMGCEKEYVIVFGTVPFKPENGAGSKGNKIPQELFNELIV